MPGSRIDYLLTRLSAWLALRGQMPQTVQRRYLDTTAGRIHLFDSEPDAAASSAQRHCIVLTPDGPNVVAHYTQLIALLAPQFRVVCFDMPGFGYSLPAANYQHTLDQGAHAVLEVLQHLHIERATLAFSCANGLYALRAAQLAPARIGSLVLTQTPTLPAMQAWAYRMIPKPLCWPGAGQLLGWLLRRKLAQLWYRSALPPATAAQPWQQTSAHAFAAGACFCLPGVVQGLLRESNSALPDMPPCTVVWGLQDRSHRATPLHSLQSCLPQAEFIDFADCGHFPDVEQPERFARLLMQHVTKWQR